MSSERREEHEAPQPAGGLDRDALPKLSRDPSFWGMVATQLLGAFNDNLYKQLMLLLAITVGSSAAASDDQQWLATFIFSLPFVLFSGYAGYLSDRFSKRPIIVLSKIAEIVVMALGMIAFLGFGATGYTGLLVVLFLMGAQSAFFAPGKYGILPEMLRERDLPPANGAMVMTTFLSIIGGTVAGGLMGNAFVDRGAPLEETAHRLWIGSAACIAIAVVGTLTSLLIRPVPAANPGLRFRLSALGVPPECRRLLAKDRSLLLAILASCAFWLVSGTAIQAVNSLGMVQLRVGDLWTSLMTAMIGVGIAVGAVVAGRMAHGLADNREVHLGLWGIFAFLLLISISLPGGQHLLGYGGSLVVLAILGACAGMFAIPVQVFIQARPPNEMKGRMIAVMNQANFVAIMLSGPVYGVFDQAVSWLGWPRSVIFALIAALILPVAWLYRLPPRVHSGSAGEP